MREKLQGFGIEVLKMLEAAWQMACCAKRGSVTTTPSTHLGRNDRVGRPVLERSGAGVFVPPKSELSAWKAVVEPRKNPSYGQSEPFGRNLIDTGCSRLLGRRGQTMMKIEINIPPFKLPEIKEALDRYYLDEFLIVEAKEFLDPRYVISTYRGIECSVDFTACTRVELFVEQSAHADIIASIRAAAKDSRSDLTITTSKIDQVIEGRFVPRPLLADP